MPSYSFQSIIQSIIDFFKNIFRIKSTKIPSQVIKNRVTHAPPHKHIKRPTLPYGIKINPNIDKTTTKIPSQVIKNRVTYVLPPTSQHINPIITRTNIVTYPYLPPLPIQKRPIFNPETNSMTFFSKPINPSQIKIIPYNSFSKVLTNNSSSSTNLSQVAIKPNVSLSQSLTQGRTITVPKISNKVNNTTKRI
jgi:hypothetical protein